VLSKNVTDRTLRLSYKETEQIIEEDSRLDLDTTVHMLFILFEKNLAEIHRNTCRLKFGTTSAIRCFIFFECGCLKSDREKSQKTNMDTSI